MELDDKWLVLLFLAVWLVDAVLTLNISSGVTARAAAVVAYWERRGVAVLSYSGMLVTNSVAWSPLQLFQWGCQLLEVGNDEALALLLVPSSTASSGARDESSPFSVISILFVDDT